MDAHHLCRSRLQELQYQWVDSCCTGHSESDSSKTEVVEKSDKKPYMDASGQEQLSRSNISPLQLPTFAGKLENYTINMNCNQQ